MPEDNTSLYEGAVWLPDSEKTFVKGRIIKSLNENKQFLIQRTGNDNDNNEEITIDADKLERCNPPQFDRCDDMASLTYLNEPSVINNLMLRYEQDSIYTYSGLFLVAINPYKQLNIYNDDFISIYKNSTVKELDQKDESTSTKRLNSVRPHIFATSEEAFQNLLKHKRDQSILVTGESGAGKTENTKRVIQYIISVASSKSKKSKSINFENQILEANPILESFGNAETVSNLNSSRFGKFVKIKIQPSNKELIGAHIDWYLLEKPRVVLQDSKERNYHVFYQFLRGATDDQLEQFKLTRSVYDYNYLKNTNHSGSRIDDKSEFIHLNKALDTMKFSSDDKNKIFKVIAVILHLGNIAFKNIENLSRQAILSEDSPVGIIAELFGISESEFKNSFLTSKVKAGREVVTQQRTASQAKFSIDALAKSLYERLFQYLVDRINESFDNNSTISMEQSNYIGILDIAGFEIFEKNSFDQLCINYTNEKLQQFFNHHMFVLEQSEYLKEGISWNYIDFGHESKPTIELIEGSNAKRVGIFSTLDEECVVPKGSDSTFLDKLHQQLESKDKKQDPNQIRYKPNKLRNGFIIKHYAGEVNYSTDGWLDKNKDPLSNTMVELLSDSSDLFIQDLFNSSTPIIVNLSDSPVKGGASKRRSGMFRTVAQRHKEQLFNLMSQLSATHPHFVRCILPNTTKSAGDFDMKLVLEQLRCNGVLEGIRIARAGYPNRIEFQQFAEYYGILAKNSISMKSSHRNAKQICELILSELNLDSEVYKVGLTKLFFRNGVLASLEKERDLKIAAIFTQFKAIAKGKLVRDKIKIKLAKLRASQVILKNFNTYNALSKDPWFKLISQLKPMLVDTDSTQSYYMQQLKELEKQVAILTSERDKEVESKSKLQKELDDLTSSVQLDRNLIADKDTELDSIKQKQVELEKRLNDKESKLSELQELHQSSNSEKKELTEKLVLLNANVNSHLKESQSLEGELTLLRKIVTEKDKTIAAIETRLKKGNTELDDKLRDANAKLSSIKMQLSKLLSENESLKANLAKAKTSADEFSKAVKTKEVESSELRQKLTSFISMKKELEKQNSLADSESKLRSEMEKLKIRYKQLKHEAKETKELLDAKINDEINFDRGKQQYDKDLSDLKTVIDGLSQEIQIEKKTSLELRQALKSAQLENTQLSKAKKSYDVKLAEFNFKLSQRPDLQLRMEPSQMKDELEMLQTRLASEAYENRQLRAHLRKLNGGSPSNSVNGDFSPLRSKLSTPLNNKSEAHGELSIEKAANKRLEKLNIDLQKELLQYKNNSRDTRGMAPVEIDYKTKYQLAEIQLKNVEDKLRQSTSSASSSRPPSTPLPLSDTTRHVNNMTNIDSPFIDKDSIVVKQDNLRLNSLLNESQTKLKRLQINNDSTFAQQEELVQLKSKLQVIHNKNNSLTESVEFYKARAENYYSKIEAAEVAVQTAKRAEELVRNELNQTKQRMAKAQQEFKSSDLTAAGLSTSIRELERDLSDKVFELRRLQEAYDSLKEKYENEDELRVSTSSSQSASTERELKLLNDDLVTLMNKETELNKQIKNVSIQLDVSKRETRQLKFSNAESVKEKDQFKKLLTETMDKNGKLLTERQEHLMKLNTLNSQVMTLKASNEDLITERDNLLESKRSLELKVAEISVEFDKHLAKAKNDATNAVSIIQLKEQLQESSAEVSELRFKLQEYENKAADYETRMEKLDRDSLMIIEENKSLTKFNVQLKSKIEDMEVRHQREKEAESKHWSTRVDELESKIFMNNATQREEDQKLYNYERQLKEFSQREEVQNSSIKRYQDEIKSLEETVSRLDENIRVLQHKEAESVLNAKRVTRELENLKESSLLMERELLDWRNGATV